jgi:L-galactose dehydrogenase
MTTRGSRDQDNRTARLGYGAAPLGNVYGDLDQAEGIRSVHRAIEMGITFFDVSPYYGLTRAEEVLGRALAGRRHEVVLCTKAGRYGADDFDFSARRIRASIDESLRRLRTDHVDILLAHDIEFGEPDVILGETIDALEEMKRAGKCRSIGVSGYPLPVLRRAIETRRLDVVLSYCHYCLFNTQLVTELLPVARKRGVAVINASPLGMRLLTDDPTRTPPPDWHPAPAAVRSACLEAAAVCRTEGASLVDLALQFAVQGPDVLAVVTGMPFAAMVERNVVAARAMPDANLLSRVLEVLTPVRNTTWPSGRPEWSVQTAQPERV